MSKNKRLIKAAIMAKYGSQADFAEVLGIDETMVSKLIHGRRPFKPGQREKWAILLDRSIDDLFREV